MDAMGAWVPCYCLAMQGLAQHAQELKLVIFYLGCNKQSKNLLTKQKKNACHSKANNRDH